VLPEFGIDVGIFRVRFTPAIDARSKAQILFEISQGRGEVLEVLGEQTAIAEFGCRRRIDRQQEI
jgi:hypothetical protein